ncbi:hypothetical protein K2173_028452 [Erythroxylum novogranatense]|uniref:Syntaxin 6/10/61 N-terminal domain-containing protein n=1 Tax=Erythroxylum novogranatense TaxID=1862640 RepID=A0AAV8U218_9ROSI|nr:hypothetical protein K2173_028452 [Erythroxylum novogranatense]
MASSFDRWEKDPFFSAAEEVQESADRMESTYRTWVHAKKDTSNLWNCEELRRDLRTSLGTTKWQLEEFQRAVKSSYVKSSRDDAKDRHHEFIVAIEDHILKIQSALRDSALSEGKTSLPWVHLDEGESNELALFLSGPPEDNTTWKIHNRDLDKLPEMEKMSEPECSKNSTQSVGLNSLESREEKLHGHRRTASASADIGAWKIAIADGGFQVNSSTRHVPQPPRKVPSLSGVLDSMELAYKFKWPNNGIRKWKPTDRHQESDTAPLRSSELTRGIDACYEKSKSCLDGYDECYNKQLYGCYGAIQRQLQRSQYQMQYSRPVRVAFSIVLLICLIVLIALRVL